MWITEKIKNNIGKTIIFVFVVFVIISKKYTDRIGEKNLENILKSKYKGVIVKKFRRRGDIIVYKNLETNKLREIYATVVFDEKSKIGDTIIKIPNQNLCVIKNKNKNIKVKCYELDFE